MGRASSAKKVARAARAGGGASAGRERSLLFPATIVLVVVLGVSLIAYARTTVDTAAAKAPGLADHFHQAYGLYICGDFAPNLADPTDPNGTHTHSDGVVHVHPGAAQQVARTGEDANMQVFLSAAGASISDSEEIELPEQEPAYEQTSYVEGEDKCGGEDAIVQVAYWEDALNTDGDPEIITENLGNIAFTQNGGAYTIAFAPEGADIPPPETAADLPELGSVDNPGAPQSIPQQPGETSPESTGSGSTPSTDGGGPSTTAAGN